MCQKLIDYPKKLTTDVLNNCFKKVIQKKKKKKKAEGTVDSFVIKLLIKLQKPQENHYRIV